MTVVNTATLSIDLFDVFDWLANWNDTEKISRVGRQTLYFIFNAFYIRMYIVDGNTSHFAMDFHTLDIDKAPIKPMK